MFGQKARARSFMLGSVIDDGQFINQRMWDIWRGLPRTPPERSQSSRGESIRQVKASIRDICRGHRPWSKIYEQFCHNWHIFVWSKNLLKILLLYMSCYCLALTLFLFILNCCCSSITHRQSLPFACATPLPPTSPNPPTPWNRNSSQFSSADIASQTFSSMSYRFFCH